MKVLDQVRHYMRTAHLAIRTERAYVNWIKRFLQYERRLAGEWRTPQIKIVVAVEPAD